MDGGEGSKTYRQIITIGLVSSIQVQLKITTYNYFIRLIFPNNDSKACFSLKVRFFKYFSVNTLLS